MENTGVFVSEWVGNSSCVLSFHDGLCVIVHVHRARECNGEVRVCVRVRVKHQDWIEYRNTRQKSCKCSRALITLLTIHTIVSKVLCFWYRLLKCAAPGGRKIKKKNLKFLYSHMLLVTQAHGLVCGVYVNNILNILIRQYFSINLYVLYFYYYLFYV